MKWSVKVCNQSLVRTAKYVRLWRHQQLRYRKEMHKDKVGVEPIIIPIPFLFFFCLDMPRHAFIWYTIDDRRH